MAGYKKRGRAVQSDSPKMPDLVARPEEPSPGDPSNKAVLGHDPLTVQQREQIVRRLLTDPAVLAAITVPTLPETTANEQIATTRFVGRAIDTEDASITADIAAAIAAHVAVDVIDGDAAGGDLTGTYPSPTIAALAVTDAKVATANKDGAAGTVSMRTLGTSGTSACAGNDARLSDSRPPNGSAGGDLTGTYPNPTIKTDVALGGNPTTTTQAVDNSSTRIATTAYVVGQAGASTPLMDGTGTVGTSTRYARDDHKHPTDTTLAKVADIQSWTTAGTYTDAWVKPTGAKSVTVIAYGSGGGGGAGGRGVAPNNSGGGGGGGGGHRMERTFVAADLPSTVTVLVGAGGTGPAGRGTSGAGTDGGVGNISRFGSSLNYCLGRGGGGGGGGPGNAAGVQTGGSGGGGGGAGSEGFSAVGATAGAGGVYGGGAAGVTSAGGTPTTSDGGGGGGDGAVSTCFGGFAHTGGAGGGTGGGVTGGGTDGGANGADTISGGGGGGGGGSMNNATPKAAAAGGASNNGSSGHGGAVNTAGNPGSTIGGGAGGGGGSGANGGTATTGGAGGYAGGGGGGGGASTGGTSGAGGVGGDGAVYVITHF